MTRYLAVYDVEWLSDVEYSLKALESVVRVHRRHDAPATFFVCGKLLHEAGSRYRDLLADGPFDVGSHTYSHYPLKQHGGAEPSCHLVPVRDEVQRTDALIRKVFGQAPVGLRGPGGYYRGLRGQKNTLQMLWGLGVRTLSTDARGPAETIPAPLTQPYWYEEEGFPEMLEIPAHDWHENVLKGHNWAPIAWPPPLPWDYPTHAPQTPEEEFEVYRRAIDWVAQRDVFFYSPPMHPWSIYRFNPEAKTLDLLLAYLKGKQIPMLTVTQLRRDFSQQKAGTA